MGLKDRWSAPRLDGRVAVVTGASRGAGRAIARVLGETGATVYCTGRTVRSAPHAVPGTIEDAAEEVSARGGCGIAVRCDHTRTDEVSAVFERVRQEQGRLDLLVNNAWGGYEKLLAPAWFWNVPIEDAWRGMFESGVRPQLLAAYYAIPLMLPRKSGLIISTVAWDRDKYIGSMYDISKHATARMIWGLARELRKHRIAAAALAPGFMRTERVLAAFRTDEQHWREFPGLKRSESPEYVGRAVASLAADRKRMRMSGQTFAAADLARAYGFTDTDGRRVPPFRLDKPFEKLIEEFETKRAGGTRRD